MRAKQSGTRRALDTLREVGDGESDGLLVKSVEKAFRVLAVFEANTPTLTLSQIAERAKMDKSAAQRFTHTLCKLGYLKRDPTTKGLVPTAKTLEIGSSYMRTNPLVKRAMPYLQHLNRETQETVNLTILDGTDIIFVSRFLSRHVLNTDVTIGTRMPAYCTAPGRAMLAALPRDAAKAILRQSNLRAYTPHTTYKLEEVLRRLDQCTRDGFATAFQEVYMGDASVAAAILDHNGDVVGAINIGTSCARFSSAEVVERFAPLAVAAALSISKQ